MALVTLSLLQLGIVTMIYRRAQFFVQLWPLAVFLVGGIANGIWWLRTGYFDPGGAMAGLTPLMAARVPWRLRTSRRQFRVRAGQKAAL